MKTLVKYCRIKIAYKYRKTMDTLSKGDDVIILKQGKCRGIVLKYKNKCTENCMTLQRPYKDRRRQDPENAEGN